MVYERINQNINTDIESSIDFSIGTAKEARFSISKIASLVHSNALFILLQYV